MAGETPVSRPGNSPLFVFGLTGGVASGKSTVARCFGSRGVHVIDADELAREVVRPGGEALREIEAAFGKTVVPNGVLDRTALASLVFSDRSALERLNQITHPKVGALFQARLTALSKRPVNAASAMVCYEVPLLFENKLQTLLRPVVVVTCGVEQQIARAMSRNGWTRGHAEQRIRAQMPLAEKAALADYIIDNDGSLEDLEHQCGQVLQTLLAQAAARTRTDALA